MTPFWHPLSGVFLADPPMPATRSAIRMCLKAGPAEVVYGGDRMFPAVRTGERVTVRPCGSGSPSPGDAVMASDGDVVDLFRVEGIDGARLALSGDADPAGPLVVEREAVLGLASLPRAAPTRRRRLLYRLGLDLREAWTGRLDAESAGTVREKYDSQAVHYARRPAPELEAVLEARIRAAVPAGRSVLVVGSGVGTEAIALARRGYRTRGIDFAPAMVAASRAAAAGAGVTVAFAMADVRAHEEPPASVDAIVFTYDVYSFLPSSASRVETLRRIARWLAPGGRLYLSARKVQDAWGCGILAIQRLRGAREYGDSHTRWFSADGVVRRSYVHVFRKTDLLREIGAAGGRCLAWQGGHGEIVFGEAR